MTHLPYDICLRLRDAGMPQPIPSAGQIWYTEDGDYVINCYPNGVGVMFVFCDSDSKIVGRSFRGFKDWTFCPDAEYILQHLPDTLKIEKYNKQWMLMVKGEYQLQDSLAHAAALAYLRLHEKTPAP